MSAGQWYSRKAAGGGAYGNRADEQYIPGYR